MALRAMNRYPRTLPGVVAAFLLAASTGYALNANPFTRLGGSWSGSGSISTAKGSTDHIRCRAGYIPADNTLRLELSCAGDSYNFKLQSDLTYDSGTISGVWTEFTRRISGKVSGTAADNQIQAVAESQTFNLLLAMTTQGDRQSIRLQSPGSELSEVLITMNRILK
jgi:hypothetical protein